MLHFSLALKSISRNISQPLRPKKTLLKQIPLNKKISFGTHDRFVASLSRAKRIEVAKEELQFDKGQAQVVREWKNRPVCHTYPCRAFDEDEEFRRRFLSTQQRDHSAPDVLAPRSSSSISSSLRRSDDDSDNEHQSHSSCPAVGDTSSLDSSETKLLPLGIGVADFETVLPLLQRNQQLPSKRVISLTTAADFQTEVKFQLYCGSLRPIHTDNLRIGEVTLRNITPAPRGHVTLRLVASVDTNFSLAVHVSEIMLTNGDDPLPPLQDAPCRVESSCVFHEFLPDKETMHRMRLEAERDVDDDARLANLFTIRRNLMGTAVRLRNSHLSSRFSTTRSEMTSQGVELAEATLRWCDKPLLLPPPGTSPNETESIIDTLIEECRVRRNAVLWLASSGLVSERYETSIREFGSAYYSGDTRFGVRVLGDSLAEGTRVIDVAKMQKSKAKMRRDQPVVSVREASRTYYADSATAAHIKHMKGNAAFF